uniref:Uncharacterized protein n=1 Tax=Anguilla anguilla TaxID=7936 RepID=A0A0E9X6C8_ANGAN
MYNECLRKRSWNPVHLQVVVHFLAVTFFKWYCTIIFGKPTMVFTMSNVTHSHLQSIVVHYTVHTVGHSKCVALCP